MPSVNTKGTDVWYASLRTWRADPDNPAVGEWRRTWRKTGVPASAPKEQAEKVAEAFQAAADKCAPTNPFRADIREFAQALESIWRAAGIAPPTVSISWREFSANFVAALDVAVRTRSGYVSQMNAFSAWLGRRADGMLWSLNHEDFEKYNQHLLKSGRSQSTARNHLVFLRDVLEDAFQRGIVARNPARLVKVTTTGGVQRLPFTVEETDAIAAYLDRTAQDEWKTAFLLGLCCGLRLSDAIGRRWADFDLQAGVLRLIPGKKARAGRVVTLPLAAPLLAHVRAQTPSGEWITPGLRKEANPSPRFSAIVESAGIAQEKGPERKGAGRSMRLKTFHALRHSLNTRLAAAGTEKSLRMLVSDHDDPRVSDRYTHGAVERLAVELAKVFPE